MGPRGPLRPHRRWDGQGQEIGPPLPLTERSGPLVGAGVGLRAPHISDVLQRRPAVPWFEILSDNYLDATRAEMDQLRRIRELYPVALHGVGLSLGSSDPLNRAYLARLRDLADRLEPAWVSDHLCWVSVGGRYLHELLPLPYTEAAVAHVAARVRQVQDTLERPVLIENVSTYLTFRASTMTEWEFIDAVAETADCGILLDVNNVYVSATNHGFAPADFLAGVSAARVQQMHLAGFKDCGSHLLDTHGAPVQPPVWELYRDAVARFGPTPVCVEWDTDLPPLDTLIAEADKASAILAASAALGRRDA